MRSVCPKCGKQGTQLIRANNREYPERKYLYFMHGKGHDCYIGRARTTSDMMRELSSTGVAKEPSSSASEDRYKTILLAMTADLRTWIKGYSPNTAVRVSVLSAGLSRILAKHGLPTSPEIVKNLTSSNLIQDSP